MQIVRDLAGYSYGRSDLVRRAMAKKKHSVMAQEREYFVHGITDESGNVVVPGCVRNGVPEDVAERIFDEMTAFASYAFNKSHAAAYSVVAIQTGWLKRHYPAEFMAALMNSVFGNSGKIAAYIQYCRANGIPILPPDVNASGWKFRATRTPDGKKGILFGLGAVKAVGQGAVENILTERKRGAFKTIFDFCSRMDGTACNKRTVESLIRVGAFDSTGANRAQMLAVYESAMDAGASRRRSTAQGQIGFFDMDFGTSPIYEDARSLPPLRDFSPEDRLRMEKEISGVYISGHPLDSWRETLDRMTLSAGELEGLEEREDQGMSLDGMQVRMGGILTEVKGKATRKGAFMGFLTLEDLTGSIECLVFPKIYEKYQGLFAEDDLVVLSGKLSIREEESAKLLVDSITRLENWNKEAAPQPEAEPVREALTDAQLADRSGTKLYLRVNRIQMDACLDLTKPYPGRTPLYFHLPEEKITLLAAAGSWVDASDGCTDALRALLGPDNVRLVMKELKP